MRHGATQISARARRGGGDRVVIGEGAQEAERDAAGDVLGAVDVGGAQDPRGVLAPGGNDGDTQRRPVDGRPIRFNAPACRVGQAVELGLARVRGRVGTQVPPCAAHEGGADSGVSEVSGAASSEDSLAVFLVVFLDVFLVAFLDVFFLAAFLVLFLVVFLAGAAVVAGSAVAASAAAAGLVDASPSVEAVESPGVASDGGGVAGRGVGRGGVAGRGVGRGGVAGRGVGRGGVAGRGVRGGGVAGRLRGGGGRRRVVGRVVVGGAPGEGQLDAVEGVALQARLEALVAGFADAEAGARLHDGQVADGLARQRELGGEELANVGGLLVLGAADVELGDDELVVVLGGAGLQRLRPALGLGFGLGLGVLEVLVAELRGPDLPEVLVRGSGELWGWLLGFLLASTAATATLLLLVVLVLVVGRGGGFTVAVPLGLGVGGRLGGLAVVGGLLVPVVLVFGLAFGVFGGGRLLVAVRHVLELDFVLQGIDHPATAALEGQVVELVDLAELAADDFQLGLIDIDDDLRLRRLLRERLGLPPAPAPTTTPLPPPSVLGRPIIGLDLGAITTRIRIRSDRPRLVGHALRVLTLPTPPPPPPSSPSTIGPSPIMRRRDLPKGRRRDLQHHSGTFGGRGAGCRGAGRRGVLGSRLGTSRVGTGVGTSCVSRRRVRR